MLNDVEDDGPGRDDNHKTNEHHPALPAAGDAPTPAVSLGGEPISGLLLVHEGAPYQAVFTNSDFRKLPSDVMSW